MGEKETLLALVGQAATASGRLLAEFQSGYESVRSSQIHPRNESLVMVITAEPRPPLFAVPVTARP
jgi:hypothetical protein